MGWDKIRYFLDKVNIWVDPRSYGVTFDDVTLGLAIAAIGANNRTLVIPPGVWSIANDLTIPTNIGLRVEMGGILQIATGKTLIINGPFEAGLYQMFSGDGSVKFEGRLTKEVYPQWFGAKGDGVTDDTIPFQKLGASAYSGATIKIPNTGNPYLITDFNCPYDNITFVNKGYIKLKAHADVVFTSPSRMGMLSFGDSTEATVTYNITIINEGIIDGNAGTLSISELPGHNIDSDTQDNWYTQYGLITLYNVDGFSIQNYGTIKNSFESGILLSSVTAPPKRGIVDPVGIITGCVNDAIANLYMEVIGKITLRNGYIKGATLMRGPLLTCGWKDGLVDNIEFVNSYTTAVTMGYGTSNLADDFTLSNVKFTDCVTSVYVNPNWPGNSTMGFPVLLVKGGLANNVNIYNLTFSQSALKPYPPFGTAIGGGTGTQKGGRYKNLTFLGDDLWLPQIIVNTDGVFDSISDMNACSTASGNNLDLSLSTGGGVVERVVATNNNGNSILLGTGMKIKKSRITTTGASHNSIYVPAEVSNVSIDENDLTSDENAIHVDGSIRSIRGNKFYGLGEGVNLVISGGASPNLGTNAVIKDNTGREISIRQVFSSAGCAAGSVEGKVKTTNAIKLRNGALFEVIDITDNYWDLTGVTTGESEYIKVALCKIQGFGSVIVKGAVATSQAAAVPPTVNPYLTVIGIVEIPNNYDGGALDEYIFYDMIGEQ